MNKDVREELKGMVDDVKNYTIVREEYKKRQKNNSKEKFLEDAKANGKELTIEMIKAIIDKCIDNTNQSLRTHRKHLDYSFKNVRLVFSNCRLIKEFSSEYQYGIDELIAAKDEIFKRVYVNNLLVAWKKSDNELVPAIIDVTFLDDYKLSYNWCSDACYIGYDYSLCGMEENIKKFVLDAINNKLKEGYELPDEVKKEFEEKIAKIGKVNRTINNLKKESSRNAKILLLDLIKDLNNNYKERTADKKSLELNDKVIGVIPLDPEEVLRILRKRKTCDILNEYNQLDDIYAFKHESNGKSKSLLVLEKHINALNDTLYDIFHVNTIDIIHGPRVSITVPVDYYESTILNIGNGKKK